MGRPLNKKYYNQTGSKIQLQAWIPGGSGIVNATIVKQRSASRFLVTDGVNTGVVTLKASVPSKEGEARILVTPFVVNTGTGAYLTCTLGLNQDYFAIDQSGKNYRVGDLLELVGGSGTKATLQVISEEYGAVRGLAILDLGKYSIAPSMPNNLVTKTGSGTGAVVDGKFSISNVIIGTAGVNYTSNPTLEFNPVGAHGIGIVDQGAVVGYNIIVGGSYSGGSNAPAISVITNLEHARSILNKRVKTFEQNTYLWSTTSASRPGEADIPLV